MHARVGRAEGVHTSVVLVQSVPSRIIVNALSVMTGRQCGHKLHRTVSPSWINVLIAYHVHDLQLLNTVNTFLCGTESWPVCPEFFFFFLSLPTGNIVWLASEVSRLVQAKPTFSKKKKAG